jgi:hypothetical protein
MSSSLESDSKLNITGSCNCDSDSCTDADDDKKDNTNRRKNLRCLLNLLLIRRKYLRQRQSKLSPPRLVWTEFVSQCIQQNEFSVTFRMSLFAFNKLAEILLVDLEVHYQPTILLHLLILPRCHCHYLHRNPPQLFPYQAGLQEAWLEIHFLQGQQRRQ